MNHFETASNVQTPAPIRVLFADDDIDDRFFFDQELSQLPIPTLLTTVENGEKLMEYLTENYDNLPDVLFLDLNMPKKNGFECLHEIKKVMKLEQLPIIIYSTSLDIDMADLLYNNGAFYYVRKTDLTELQKVLQHVMTLLVENTFNRPEKEKFVLSFA